MSISEKVLGQQRPTNTSNTDLYTATGVTTVVTALHICNTTASDATCRVFYLTNAGTADETSAMLYDFNILANDYHSFSPEKPHIIETGGKIVVQSGTSSALTFTVSGMEIS